MPLCSYILYTTGGALNLPAVLAGAAVAFLLLMLLIAGISVGAVLLRKLKKKTRTLNNGEWVDGMEHIEKSTEFTGRGRESAAGHSEQWADEAAFQYEQHVADMHYESTDFDGEGCCGREDGHAIRSERNQSPTTMVVDKSKNCKGEKTQGAASAITTQGADTEEQHYECSSGFGQDWFGTAVEVNPETTLRNAAKGFSSIDTDTNGEQFEPYNTNAVCGMVDRSKKKIQSIKSGDLISSTYGMDGM